MDRRAGRTWPLASQHLPEVHCLADTTATTLALIHYIRLCSKTDTLENVIDRALKLFVVSSLTVPQRHTFTEIWETCMRRKVAGDEAPEAQLTAGQKALEAALLPGGETKGLHPLGIRHLQPALQSDGIHQRFDRTRLMPMGVHATGARHQRRMLKLTRRTLQATEVT